MGAAATARSAPATARPATRRKRRPTQRRRPAKPRPRLVREGQTQHASAARLVRPAMAGVALFPQAAVRSVGAVRDISDSGLIVRLTRGSGWIGVLCALLVGIVALNVISLSLNAGAGRLSLQIDELKTEVSGLQAQIDERLSASRLQQEAEQLGLAVPNPKSITYLHASEGDAQRLARLLSTDSFLTAPSLPSSYPAPGTSYAPVSTSSTPPTTTTATSTGSSGSSSGTAPAGTTTGSGSGSVSGSSSGSGSPPTAPPSGGTTGGVGL
jgi:hypothetical protein